MHKYQNIPFSFFTSRFIFDSLENGGKEPEQVENKAEPTPGESAKAAKGKLESKLSKADSDSPEAQNAQEVLDNADQKVQGIAAERDGVHHETRKELAAGDTSPENQESMAVGKFNAFVKGLEMDGIKATGQKSENGGRPSFEISMNDPSGNDEIKGEIVLVIFKNGDAKYMVSGKESGRPFSPDECTADSIKQFLLADHEDAKAQEKEKGNDKKLRDTLTGIKNDNYMVTSLGENSTEFLIKTKDVPPRVLGRINGSTRDDQPCEIRIIAYKDYKPELVKGFSGTVRLDKVEATLNEHVPKFLEALKKKGLK